MLFHADPLVPVDLPDRSYDAIVAPDIFTRAGAGPEVLGECVRLLRAGGLISLAAPEEAGPLLDGLAGPGELLQMDRTWDRLSDEPGIPWLVPGLRTTLARTLSCRSTCKARRDATIRPTAA